MVVLKNIPIILFSIIIFGQAQAVKPRIKPDVQVKGNKGAEIRSNTDSNISLISAQESEGEKNYRWGVTRSLPLKVIQGWYEFDEEGIRSHGGGGRKIAETRPMQLTLRISKENGFLLLHRGYGWSSTIGDQKAGITCKIEWPADAVLRTYYLSEPAGLTHKLQPVWKGELIQDAKVSKSVVYAVRVVGENVSDELFDAGDTSEPLRIGRTWAPIPDPTKKKYEGRTIEEWISQWDSRLYDDKRAATEALTRIGQPAVPAMIELMKEGGNRASRARVVLGKMGPQVEGEEQVLQGEYGISGTVVVFTSEPSQESFDKLVALESEEDYEQALGAIITRPAINVVVTARSESITREAVTDTEGKFQFLDLPRGDYEVSTVTPTSQAAGAQGKRLVTARQKIKLNDDSTVLLKLREDFVTVRGRITDVNGQPVASAKVIGIAEIVDPSNMHDPRTYSTVSDADGYYELHNIDHLNLWRIAGFLNGGDPTADLGSFYFVVRVEADGFVQDRENVPRFPLVTENLLDAARCLLKAMNQLETRWSGISKLREKDGLPALPASQGNTIPGIDIVLDRRPVSAHVLGRVLDTKGKSAPRRTVLLSLVYNGPPPIPGVSPYADGRIRNDITDENGVFDIPELTPGKYTISMDIQGGSMHQEPVNGKVLTVKPGERLENFEILINPPEDFAISGHVRDARGNPIPRVFVDTFIPHGSHWFDHTSDKGNFHIKGLDGMGISSFRVNFKGTNGAEGFKLAIPDVPLNSKNVYLIVPDKGSINGVVRDAKTGAAVTTYEVTVPVVNLPDSGALWDKPNVKIERNPDHGFNISNIPAGEVTVEVSAQGLGVQRFVTMIEAGKINQLECEMLGPAILEGRTTLDGKPRGTSIVINGQWLHSDADGNFRFDQYPNGDYTIWFFGWGDGWNHRSAEVNLVSGQSTRLEMEMGGSCEVRGKIIFREEEGPCMVRLAAKPAPGGWSNNGRPDPDDFVLSYSFVPHSGGGYRLHAIPPGRWYLMVGRYRSSMHRSLLAMSKVIELKEEETLSLDIDLTETGIPKKASVPSDGELPQNIDHDHLGGKKNVQVEGEAVNGLPWTNRLR